MSVCGQFGNPDFPDVGNDEIPCCEASFYIGPAACTCWTPVYDRDQAPIDQDAARALAAGVTPTVRPDGMCGDCAYRPNSPEKNRDPDYAGTAAELERLAASPTDRFFCHDGIRRVIKWVHPSGAEFIGPPSDYRPPIHERVPYQADGQPGYACAGWDARRRALIAQATREEALR